MPLKHIRRMKDVKELALDETNCEEVNNDNKDGHIRLFCPITQAEFNGFNRFKFNWGCRCLFSCKAEKEIGSKSI